MTATRRRLGTGVAFPVVPAPATRTLRWRDGGEKVRDAIRLILATERGERVMRPTFGAGLRRFLMEPNSVATRALIEREVTDALEAWEPRITLVEVAVSPGSDPALVNITIRYEHVRDGSTDVLVYPFYLESRP
jgi:uncharacterized protein